MGPVKYLLRVALSWLVLLAFPVAALAHAQLESTTPEGKSVLPDPPEAVVLHFNEPANPAALRWISPDGTSIDTLGRSEGLDVIVDPPPPSGEGSYLLSWRVVSLDGHPVSGTLVISIGSTSEVPSLRDYSWPPASTWWAIGTKFALSTLLVVGVGAAVFLAFVSHNIGSARRVAVVALSLVAPVAGLAVSAQGVDLLAAPVGSLVSVTAFEAGAGTSFVRTAGLSVIAAVIALALLATPLRHNKPARWGFALAAWVAAALAYVLSGHTASAEPQPNASIAMTLHVMALIFWLGALWPLVIAVASEDRDQVLRRFSNLAIPMVVILLVTGVMLTSINLGEGRFKDLAKSGYGVLLFMKVCGVIGLILLAVHNRLVLTPAIAQGAAGAVSGLRKSIRAEIVIALLVVAFASSFRLTPPTGTTLPPPPIDMVIAEQGLELRMELSPGRVGPNTLWMKVRDENGETITPLEVAVSFQSQSKDIEAIKEQAIKRKNGGWKAGPVNLPFQDTWHLEVDVLISDFEVRKLETTFTPWVR